MDEIVQKENCLFCAFQFSFAFPCKQGFFAFRFRASLRISGNEQSCLARKTNKENWSLYVSPVCPLLLPAFCLFVQSAFRFPCGRDFAFCSAHFAHIIEQVIHVSATQDKGNRLASVSSFRILARDFLRSTFAPLEHFWKVSKSACFDRKDFLSYVSRFALCRSHLN